MKLFSYSLVKTFIKFAGVGGITTATQYVLLILFVEILVFNGVFASGFSYFLSAILSYQLNYSFTFKSNASHRSALTKFSLVALIGLCINLLVFGLVNEIWGLHYLIAQLTATGIVLVWNFTANNLWSFKH